MNTKLRVDKDNAVLWWLDVNAVAVEDWPRLEALLDDSERARADRIHFQHDRQAYVAAHALGRALLSTFADGEPSAWRFTIGEHGKPEVIAPTRLRLNLSHTRGLAAAVLGEAHDIGIDVEWLERRPPAPGLAQRKFAPAECAQLDVVPPEKAVETFLTFWTLKEAYIKAIGKGLTQSLASFAFTLDPLSIRFEEELDEDPSRWLFRRLRPTPQHLMALAMSHPAPQSVGIVASAMNVSGILRGLTAK